MPKFLTDEQMKALEENQNSGFISDEQMSELESRVNRLKNPQYGPPEGVRDIGKFMQQRVGDTIEFVDKYSPIGSPLRAYLLARQQGKPFSEAVSAYTSGFGEKAPPASEIMAGYGVPSEKRIHLKPMGPFPDVKMSPADIAGAGFDFMTDPLTYAPIGSVGKVGKAIGTGLEKVAGKVAPKLGEFAADRAVKAAIGQSIAQERKLAGLPKGSINFEKMAAKRKEAGELMLENQDIPWFGKPADIAPRLQAKTEKTGEVLGEIGKIVDQIAPQGSVSGDDIAQKMLAYAETIPDTVGGNALKERIAKEAEIVAGRSLTFEEALKRKNMFKYESQTPDMLVSNKDVTNKLYGIHTEAIDDAVEATSRASWIPEEAKSALEQFKGMKKQYGQYKNLATASTERALKDASVRQYMSPTDYMAGAIGGIGSSGDTVDKLLIAGTVGAGHKLVRERGSAFAARSANAVKNMLSQNPEKFQKWGQILSAAGASGYESLVVQHHLLMNSDKEYAKAVAESTMTPKEGPYKYAADALDASGLAQVGMAGIVLPLTLLKPGKLVDGIVKLIKDNPKENFLDLKKAWLEAAKKKNFDVDEKTLGELFDNVKENMRTKSKTTNKPIIGERIFDEGPYHHDALRVTIEHNLKNKKNISALKEEWIKKAHEKTGQDIYALEQFFDNQALAATKSKIKSDKSRKDLFDEIDDKKISKSLEPKRLKENQSRLWTPSEALDVLAKEHPENMRFLDEVHSSLGAEKYQEYVTDVTDALNGMKGKKIPTVFRNMMDELGYDTRASNQIREKYDPKSQAISRKLDFIKNQADDVPKIDEFDNLAGMLKKDPTMNNKATSSAYRKLDDFLYNAMPTEQYRMFQELIHSDKFDEAKMLAQKYLNKEK